MFINSKPASRLIGFTISILFGASVWSLAQADSLSGDHVLKAPKDEKFKDAADLMVPSRSVWRTCAKGFVANPTDDCPTITSTVWRESHLLSIYDSSGEIWNHFSINPWDPAYFLNFPRNDFKPLGPTPAKMSPHPDLVILRLVKESKNWYEVEVNEETRDTKFILKSDPLWARTSWSSIFNLSFNVVVDQSRTKLREKPEGKVIAECADSTFQRMNFAKLEGDWMLVSAGTPEKLNVKSCNGWIRWRDGRNILVGSILNGMKIPETKSIEN